jgi:hypothetical protein
VAKANIEIRSLARSHTETAIKVLAGVMNSDDQPAAARVAAAQALLDRGWGKAHQTAEVTYVNKPATQLTDDELAGIVTERSGEGVVTPPVDPSQLN